jgi:hypothetical protein
MRRQLSKRIGIAVSILLTASSVVPASAGQQQWGASYLDWSGALLSSSSKISQVIEPLEISPYTYWEAGWHWDNVPDGGYGGIQSKGNLADGRVSDLAIFSIWNGLGAIPGEGAGCTPFGGEGIGYSCRIPITLVAGNKYEISFGVDSARGPQWWTATISDLAKGTKNVIGSIETNSLIAKASNWNNFIEYWGQAVPCDAVGPASAKFHVPTSSNPDIEIYSPKFSRPTQPCVMSAGDTPPPGFIGDAIIRFGGAQQAPSTQTMPYRKTKAQLVLDKATEDKEFMLPFNALVLTLDKYKTDISKLFINYPGYFEQNPEMKSSLQRAIDYVIPTTPSKVDYDSLADLISGGVGKKALASDFLLAQIGINKYRAIEKIKSKSVNKVTSVICVKGKTLKKVSAVNPKCPAGYKKK